MRLIRQRAEFDCGIAVAAMLASVSYRRAWTALKVQRKRTRGVRVHEMAAALRRLTRRRWVVRRITLRPAEARAVLVPAVRNHWIVVTTTHVLDPSLPWPVRRGHGRPPRHLAVVERGA